MKISLMSYTLARGPWGKEPDLIALCELAKELELDGVDWVTVYNFAPSDVAKVTADYGLKNICYTFSVPIHHEDANTRKKALGEVERGLEIASILGSDKIMLPLSRVEGQSKECSQKYALESLSEAVNLAKAYHITVTIEHFHGQFAPFITSKDFEEAANTIPGLRITYDNGNIYTAGEDPAAAFLKVSDYIVHAHFKDWKVSSQGQIKGLDGRTYEPALVGEGVVDSLPCLKAMKSAGYTGYINMEYEGTEYDPKNAIVQGTKYLQELIASL